MWSQYLLRVIESGRTTPHKLDNLLQLRNVIESIATFTIAKSEFGLLVGDRSFWVDASRENRSRVCTMLETHRTKPYVSLYWTPEGDPSFRLVQGCPLTADI